MPGSPRRSLVVISIAAALVLAGRRAGAQRAPSTDIYLATITRTGDRLTVGSATNITHRPGYDNQPAFTADGRSLLYTSVRGAPGSQSDIYRIDIATGRETPVTTTPESEYSPTTTPDGSGISVVRVEHDSTQRLWRFPNLGGAPSLVLERVKPVGYHAWGDDHTLALFVLGSPNTLQVADTRTGRADTLATRIGRAIQKVPRKHEIGFVEKRGEHDWWLAVLDLDSRKITPAVRMPDGVEDFVWLPDGSALAGKGSTLLRWDAGDAGWREVADLAASGVHGITRLAVSPEGDRLAIVADDGR